MERKNERGPDDVFTACLCPKCKEFYEADRKHVCRRRNSYPMRIPETKHHAQYLGFSNHDCESHYKCPVCEKSFGSWSVFHQEKNENGTKDYCPHCKTELEGLN